MNQSNKNYSLIPINDCKPKDPAALTLASELFVSICIERLIIFIFIVSIFSALSLPTKASANSTEPFHSQNSNSVEIEIETGTETYGTQTGYTFKEFGDIRFTKSALQVGLHERLLEIKTLSLTGKKLVNHLKKKGGAVVWEVARLKSEGDLVLPIDIFGYMDKNNYHSGLMRLNHNALEYIIIDVTSVSHETISGNVYSDINNIMAHEAIHAILPNKNLIKHYKNGRALTELFTAYYTNQIRSERKMPLRITYSDPLTNPFDGLVREGLKNNKIQQEDLIGNLQYRIEKIASNYRHEPSSLDQYGISKKLLTIFEENGLLEKK